MTDVGMSNGSGGSNAKLAMMLRECADLVERNELNPMVYQAWGALNKYVKEHGGTRVTTTTTHVPPPGRTSRSISPETRKPSVVPDDLFAADASAGFSQDGGNDDKPFDEDTPPRSAKKHGITITTTTTTTTAASSGSSHQEGGSVANRSKDPFGFGNVAKKLGKFGLGPPPKSATAAEKSATSKKNADRVKADLAAELGGASDHHKTPKKSGGGYGREDEFCEEHFTMGCACKVHHIGEANQEETTIAQKPVAETIKTAPSNTSTTTASPPTENRTIKPAFHRPSKPNSTLIANGWIEQQRRSRMRSAWKEVLASLVEGRTPQEETTLWIQRQVTNADGKPQLQALHQIPMKWLESVNYLEFYTDNRFTIKVYNVPDEFQFRCSDPDSAQNWVLTLRSVSEVVKQQSGGSSKDANSKDVGLHNLDDWDGVSNMSGQTESSSHRMTIKELQAIAHGAGYTTSGMERSDLERLVTEIALRSRSAQKDAAVEEQRRRQQEEEMRRRQQEEEMLRRERVAAAAATAATVEPAQPRMGVAELRSIAHGAGYNTSGMERAELERLVAKISADEASLQQQKDAALEAQRRKQELAETEHRRRQQEAEAEQRRRQQEAEAEKIRRQKEAEAEQIRRQQEAEAELRRQEEEQKRLKELEKRRRQHEEEQRRLAEAEQLRRQQEEEERRRRLAEQQAAEQRKKQEEEQRRKWQQQQAAAEEQRRRMAEQQAAEQQRKKQEWERAQWQAQQAAQAAAQRAEWEKKWHAQQRQQSQYPQQQAGYPGQQNPPPQQAPPPQGYRPPPPQQAGYQPPPNAQGYRPPPPPPQPQQQAPASPADLKYAKMADQSDSGQAITAIKRNILVNWALQPPTLQMLRPIDVLITTIHNVFPPAFGVKGHDYFTKWTPIARETIVTVAGAPDEPKLKKAVRKLRFFLHPDKLPRDLNEEQSFMCKMLWDITSDAFEEFHKKNEELGWIHN